MMRRREATKFPAWLERTLAEVAPAELRRFAQGLQSNLDAVRAALRLPWSNGPVEGHINRLKLLKRQMYGRANFDLLRCRFLHRPEAKARQAACESERTS